jgi:membrane-associated protease RseP (regulator of RpoE activity)
VSTDPGRPWGPEGEGTDARRVASPPPTRRAAADAPRTPAPAPDPALAPDPAPASTAWAIVRLVAVVATIVAVLLIAGLGDLLVFLVALILIVIVHELGHFVTAKWSHMKVTEYFIGFGPRLWSVRHGETVYGIKPILAGAYVKIPGMTNMEEVDPADEPRTYRQQPFHRRVIVASAGSFMHYVMAFLLAWVAVVAFGVAHGTRIEVTGFVKWAGRTETAAQLAGMKAGDTIVSVDGTAISSATQLEDTIQRSGGRPVSIVVTRAGTQRTLTVQPVIGHKTKTTKEVIGTGTSWLIGIQTEAATRLTPEGAFRGLGTAAIQVGRVTQETVIGLGHVFSPGGLRSLFDQVTNPQAAKQAAANPATSNRVESVVGAARLATQAEQAGVYYFLYILIALNVVIGLINMLPMLPLDGGHVAIAVYERIRTRRGRPSYHADAAKLLPVAYAFMAVLLVIVGSAVFLDIAHPVANPFG